MDPTHDAHEKALQKLATKCPPTRPPPFPLPSPSALMIRSKGCSGLRDWLCALRLARQNSPGDARFYIDHSWLSARSMLSIAGLSQPFRIRVPHVPPPLNPLAGGFPSRGVVRLFNAVATAQQQQRDAQLLGKVKVRNSPA